jgi:hypothetical protein
MEISEKSTDQDQLCFITDFDTTAYIEHSGSC